MELNLRMLRVASLGAAAVVAFFLAITPLMFPLWYPRLPHLLFIPVLLIFYFFAVFYRCRAEKNSHVVTVACVLFEAAILVFVVLLDAFFYPTSPGAFFPLVIITLPVLFILPFCYSYTLIAFSEVVYAFALFSHKTPRMALTTLFNALVGFVVCNIIGWIVMALRVSDYHLRNQYLSRSLTDTLTGVSNKGACEEAISRYLAQHDDGAVCMLLMLDVDNFKSINDQYGHPAGDSILREFGALLRRTFRTSDVVGRVGGDEFTVLMRDTCDEAVLSAKCAQIFAGTQAIGKTHGFSVSCSIGTAVVNGISMLDYPYLFRYADNALYESKTFGRGHYVTHPVKERIRHEHPLMLIADDDAMTRALLRTIFEKEYDLLEAPDGDKALALIGQYQEELSVVLLDVMMPGKNGIEILQYLKSRASLSAIPVVIITADEASEKTALVNGAADVIPKPIDSDITRIRVSHVFK
ncbi:MAG: diguanylate cyclase [Faecalibacterium sp.]|jgi:diguanylate cyclase (GGDEF)-like protein|nr:diguanylate cyclase [Faecalibacterium sp.]